MIKYILPLFLFIAITACNKNNNNNDRPVAKVNDKVLLLSEVQNIIPKNTEEADSILLGTNYIHQWIKKQLIISKAELNLTEQDKDVSKMVEDYRSSLIIHKYEQQLIEQKLDTAVSQSEIDNYYRNYSANFTLNKNIIRALFIKIPIPVPNLPKIQKLYKSEKDEDWEQLEDYCFQNATKFDNFSDQWIFSKELLNMIPLKVENEDKFLKSNRSIEANDSTHHYFIKIKDVKFKNNLAPLEFVRDDIRKIIINKRKIEFIKNLEESIYRDAESKNKFKIY